MKKLAIVLVALGLGSCAAPPRPEGVDPSIISEVNVGTSRRQPTPAAVDQALLPPVRMEMPELRGQAIDPRFDLSVSNAPAAQVFNSIVSGTRYSMLVPPGVTGTISVNLKDVTIQEALDAIRELYGYEYKVQGTRIFIQPISIQTRVFNVNYLIGQRLGRSDLRVTSGSVNDSPGISTGATGVPGAPGATPVALPGAPGAAGLATISDSARIQTQTRSDFWDDLDRTLKTFVGNEPGRSVVVNPQAGVVVVRAMPAELRSVEAYLKAIESSAGRQIVLEAKIIEVTLNGQYQSGINWAAFFAGQRLSVGPVSPGTLLAPTGSNTGTTLATGASSITRDAGASVNTITSPAFGADAGRNLINFNAPGASLFGLAFQTRNFAALLTFLESQGNVQVLSSPRIATINNQKAVLKVGTDQFFLTSISGSTSSTTTTTSGTTTPAFPAITLRPFFSGVALDITPQIDEDSNITLHIHPAVSDVQTDNRQINLGLGFGAVSLPLAKSSVSETDSVVKVSDGNIVAIGGLMKLDFEDNRSGLPGLQDAPLIGDLFRSTTRTMVKKELVILIKPTVVHSDKSWEPDVRETRNRLESMGRGR